MMASAFSCGYVLGSPSSTCHATIATAPTKKPDACPYCDEGEIHRPSSVPGDEGWQECDACGGEWENFDALATIVDLRRQIGDLMVDVQLASQREPTEKPEPVVPAFGTVGKRDMDRGTWVWVADEYSDPALLPPEGQRCAIYPTTDDGRPKLYAAPVQEEDSDG